VLSEEYMTLTEVRAALGCSRWTVRRRVEEGLLDVHYLPGSRTPLYLRAQVARLASPSPDPPP
jgi:hypothetical protein